MIKSIFFSTMIRDGFEDYYLRQAGSGLPVFVGYRHQVGHGGLGNILGGLARMMVPVLKRSGKTLLQEGLRTGINVLGDISQGENVKKSIKKRAKESTTRIVDKANDALRSGAPPGQPKKNNKKRPLTTQFSQSTQKRKRKRTSNDVFP